MLTKKNWEEDDTLLLVLRECDYDFHTSHKLHKLFEAVNAIRTQSRLDTIEELKKENEKGVCPVCENVSFYGTSLLTVERIKNDTIEKIEKWAKENKLYASEKLLPRPYIDLDKLLTHLNSLKK